MGLAPLLPWKLCTKLFSSGRDREISEIAPHGYRESRDNGVEDAQCFACGGRLSVSCWACDGTGIWNAASESAGLYQREAAQRGGYCAWCDGTGEVECRFCEGTGVASVSADSDV
jgi:hypothetical protein